MDQALNYFLFVDCIDHVACHSLAYKMENSLAFAASAYNTAIVHDIAFRIAQYCCHNKADEDTS